MKLILLLALATGAFAASPPDKVLPSEWGTINAADECARPVPADAKVVTIDESCVIVRRYRNHERTCQFIYSNHTTGYVRDRLHNHCVTTTLERP